MLSRVADALFWMSRYLERAEHVARLLDVASNLDIDLHGVAEESLSQLQWTALKSVLPPSDLDELDSVPSVSDHIRRRLTFELGCSTSIMSCVNRARNNARSIRGTITGDMWLALNRLYWHLSDESFRRQAYQSPHDILQAVQSGTRLFQGACDATMLHDHSWYFIQLGKHLERAEKTLRVLSEKCESLGFIRSETSPLEGLHWAAALRSCSAFESYQRLYISRVEPERVIEFLLTNPDFPYSVRYCLDKAVQAILEISGERADRLQSPAGRTLSQVISNIQFAETSMMTPEDLHKLLRESSLGCGKASHVLQLQYALQ